MRVTLFHNVSADECGRSWGAFGYQPGDALVPVFDYEDDTSPNVRGALEQAWERFNVGTDKLAASYRARRNRSLSVGDVVLIRGERTTWHAVASLGYDQIDAPTTLVWASQHGTEPLPRGHGRRSYAIPLGARKLDY